MKHFGSIDGLRAVAAISVTLFHAKITSFSGGFLGVDIFFVISGFLISGILLRDIEAGRFTYAGFLARRVVRIAPASLFWIFLSVSLFLVVFPPDYRVGVIQSAVSAALSLSNIWFYSTVDYFGDVSGTPLLHTWSLGVEEQFYLALPAVLLFAKRWPGLKGVGWLLLALASVSLAISQHLVVTDPAGAFYFAWSRAWEFLVGAGVAWLAHTGRIGRNFSVVTGPSLLGLLACIVFNVEGAPFPGVYALPVVLCSAGVVAGAYAAELRSATRDWANRLLSSPVFRWCGKISYSMYLAHWPVMCVLDRLLSLSSWKTQCLGILLSFVLGWASWKFIENPTRTKFASLSAKEIFAGFIGANTVALGMMASVFGVAATLWNRLPSGGLRIVQGGDSLTLFGTGQCFVTPKSIVKSGGLARDCLAPQAGVKTVLLLGDSHAANIAKSLREKLDPGVRLAQATAAGCFPLVDARQSGHCRVLDAAFSASVWSNNNAPTKVVLVARWEPKHLESLVRTIKWLEARGAHVYVVGRWPEYFMPLPLAVTYQDLLGIKFLSSLEKAEVREQENRLSLNQNLQHVYVPVYRGMLERTSRLLGSAAVDYFDRDHLNREGAVAVTEMIVPYLARD